ncbi:MAG: hypothetical protein ACT4OV_01805 [Microthrixaceae bacterium]
MDLNKLTTSDKIIAGSGIVLFIAYFMPWFKVDFGPLGGSASASGSDVGFFWATLPMLLGVLAAAAVIANKLFDVTLPTLPIPWGQAFLGAGAIAAILVVLKLLIGEDPSSIIDRAFGLFLAALAAIGLAVGGFLKFQEGDSAPPSGGGSGSAPF